MRKILLVIFLFMGIYGIAQMPTQLNSSQIYQDIKKLNVLGNVLYLAAHPDDENTRFIGYCANEKGFNTAYLSLTRGDGGQNLIGTEIREELGIIRTQELLAARRIDGGQQYFTRANDFGYSKTSEETLEIWNKYQILADVVWVIRKFKPDVIVCRFPTDGGGGHGHHTASALLAQEAFELAGDKTKYPEQLKFVTPWKPTRMVINTGKWWNDSISANDSGVVTHDIGVYNEIMGTSYNELAAKSRSMHKSQGFGSTGSRGNYEEFFEHLSGIEAKNSLFDGFLSDWDRVEGSSKIKLLVNELITSYQISNPSNSIEKLLVLRKEINGLNDIYWKETKMNEIDQLIINCLGLFVEASADEYSKSNGDSLQVNFELINRSNYPIKLNKIASNSITFSKPFNLTLENNIKTDLKEKFIVPNLPISQPYWLVNEGTLGTYRVENQQLIGKPENDPTIQFTTFLTIGEQEISLDVPLIYKWTDPVHGELYRPFIIVPKLSVNIEQPIYLFSKEAEQQVVLTLKAGKKNQSGKIEIIAPQGWELVYNGDFDLKNKGDEQKIKVSLKPKIGQIAIGSENGLLKVFLDQNQLKELKTINYDHIPPQTWFPASETKLVFVDIVKKGKKIGYIVGAGDLIPEALRNIGFEVDILNENNLGLDNLKQYDAILTGIRFFNVNERASFMIPKLLKYVEEGGNLIVQYNTHHELKTTEFAPYPITLSKDRVTEENAKVTILQPNHRVLNFPNKITNVDFENWVQERGLYFPNKWDKNYTPILRWHDKGEDAKDGSLLIAKYGKGYYTYTGISFFRELPAGVPGAYRLLVNIISLENE